MNKTVALLTIVLVAQIGLTFGLRHLSDEQVKQATKKLISADLGQVTEIDLESKTKSTMRIVRNKDKWLLSDFQNFPASSEAVEQLLTKFKAISRGWPVATTEDALSRFKLKADDFEEKVTLKNGSSTLATLLIGSTAGHNKLHVRLDNETEVHTVEVPLRQLSTNKEDWIDRSAVELDTAKITAVELPAFSLIEKGKEWQMNYSGKTVMLDDAASSDVLTAAAGINISEVLGTEAKPEYGLAAPAFQYTVTLKDGRKLVYKFGKLAGGNFFFVLKQPDGDFYLKIDPWFLNRVRNEDPAALIKKSDLMRKMKSSSKSNVRQPADQHGAAQDAGELPPPPIRKAPDEADGPPQAPEALQDETPPPVRTAPVEEKAVQPSGKPKPSAEKGLPPPPVHTNN